MLGEFLGNLLELLGRVPGNSGDILGATRSGPGLSWMPLVTSGEGLGHLLGWAWVLLDRSWVLCGGTCEAFAAFLGTLVAVLGRSWLALGRSWGALGGSGALLAAHKERPTSSGP